MEEKIKWGGYTPNNIYNVDCYEAIKNIPDKSIDLIVTDPPYLIKSLVGGGMAKEKHISNVMEEIGSVEINIGINEEILNHFIRIMKKPNIYIWCNKSQIAQYIDYFVIKMGLNIVPIIWNKTNAMPLCGGKYLDDCEYCLYFYKGVRLNTTYETAKTVYLKPINKNDKDLYEHPTIKPLDIVKNLITNSSNENDVVLDTFLGSGTTAVACKELGRQYIGFEINKHFYDIACDRLKGISVAERKAIDKGQQTLFDFLE